MDAIDHAIRVFRKLLGDPSLIKMKHNHAVFRHRMGFKKSKLEQDVLKQRIRMRLVALKRERARRIQRDGFDPVFLPPGIKFMGYRIIVNRGRNFTKPVFRYKLRTRVTRYCGYRFVEWL